MGTECTKCDHCSVQLPDGVNVTGMQTFVRGIHQKARRRAAALTASAMPPAKPLVHLSFAPSAEVPSGEAPSATVPICGSLIPWSRVDNHSPIPHHIYQHVLARRAYPGLPLPPRACAHCRITNRARLKRTMARTLIPQFASGNRYVRRSSTVTNGAASSCAVAESAARRQDGGLHFTFLGLDRFHVLTLCAATHGDGVIADGANAKDWWPR